MILWISSRVTSSWNGITLFFLWLFLSCLWSSFGDIGKSAKLLPCFVALPFPIFKCLAASDYFPLPFTLLPDYGLFEALTSFLLPCITGSGTSSPSDPVPSPLSKILPCPLLLAISIFWSLVATLSFSVFKTLVFSLAQSILVLYFFSRAVLATFALALTEWSALM